ncbi:HAD family hydrolase [Paludisphaera sp.]|uniref:D-glycero-alpha-D-manno-heptose-1,7-bisphosphate 7-phosphatase n=1 Tax=Paludisphaera sp. TaxID=2017432 RepID=UPI00301D5CA0
MSGPSRRAVFLDKDGTLVDDVPYNVDPDRIRLAQGAAEALPRLKGMGFRLIVVSNQSGVARGMFEEEALGPVMQRLQELTTALGAPLDGFYYCPHHPQGSVDRYVLACDCRKPAPGMILRAAAEHGVDTAASWLVGDILDDVEAGRRAGCRAVLIDNGNETEWVRSPIRTPDVVAAGLDDAARRIAAAVEADSQGSGGRS